MFDTPQGRERIARLEERSESQSEEIEKIFGALDAIDIKVERILERQDRQVGFFSGIVFSFGFFGAAVGALGSELVKKIMGH